MKDQILHTLVFAACFVFSQSAAAQLSSSKAEVDLRLSGGKLPVITGTDFLKKPELFSEKAPSRIGPLQVVPGEYVDDELSKIPKGDPLYAISEKLRSRIDKRCSDAAAVWKKKLAALGGERPDVTVDMIIRKAKSDSSSVSEGALKYDEHCLSKQDTLPTNLVDGGIKNVIAFVVSGGVPICGALRIKPNFFVTAKHCFFNSTNGKQHTRTEAASVVLLEDMKKSHNILRLFKQSGSESNLANTIPIPEDYIFMEIQAPDPVVAMPELKFEFAKPGDNLVLVGYYRFHDIHALLAASSVRVEDPDWHSGIRWDASLMCAAVEVVPPCRVHYCQSAPQFSGSPIFKKLADDGSHEQKLVVSGLHVSTTGENSGCKFQYSARQGNIAIEFPHL